MRRLVLLLAFSLCVRAGFAIQFTDINGDQSGSVWIDGTSICPDIVHYRFDLVNDTLENGIDIEYGDTINSARLYATIKDDESDTWNPLTWEVALVMTDDPFTLYFTDIDGGVYDFDVLGWVSDYVMNISINGWGDFRIQDLRVEGDFTEAVPHAPEPATLALMAVGSAGIGLWRRRRIPHN